MEDFVVLQPDAGRLWRAPLNPWAFLRGVANAWYKRVAPTALDEQLSVEKALEGVERELYLRGLRREVDVALVGFYADPCNAEARW